MSAASLLFAFALSLRAIAAVAATPDTVYLDDLTWTELRDRIAHGTTTIIVPIGGTEQNGPHMALGKHNVRATLLSERIARGLGNALVAPTLAYVPEGNLAPPSAHMRYPGTITIPDATFEKLLEYAARSFKLHGFRDIVLLGDHGGYQKSLKAVADRLDREWAATPVRVHAPDAYYRAADTEFAKALRSRGYTEAEIGTHAGLSDTSLTLALDPRLVRIDRLSDVAGSQGVAGDPRRASAALGQPGVDAVVAESIAAIKRATARH